MPPELFLRAFPERAIGTAPVLQVILKGFLQRDTFDLDLLFPLDRRGALAHQKQSSMTLDAGIINGKLIAPPKRHPNGLALNLPLRDV